MRNAQGYLVVSGPEQETLEADTFTCAHCNRIVIVPPRATPDQCGGMCGMEMKPICLPCVGVGTCTPFEKQLERMERSAAFHRALGG